MGDRINEPVAEAMGHGAPTERNEAGDRLIVLATELVYVTAATNW